MADVIDIDMDSKEEPCVAPSWLPEDIGPYLDLIKCCFSEGCGSPGTFLVYLRGEDRPPSFVCAQHHAIGRCCSGCHNWVAATRFEGNRTCAECRASVIVVQTNADGSSVSYAWRHEHNVHPDTVDVVPLQPGYEVAVACQSLPDAAAVGMALFVQDVTTGAAACPSGALFVHRGAGRARDVLQVSALSVEHLTALLSRQQTKIVAGAHNTHAVAGTTVFQWPWIAFRLVRSGDIAKLKLAMAVAARQTGAAIQQWCTAAGVAAESSSQLKDEDMTASLPTQASFVMEQCAKSNVDVGTVLEHFQCADGHNLLTLAVIAGLHSTVSALLTAGAHPHHLTSDGTAVELAELFGCDALFKPFVASADAPVAAPVVTAPVATAPVVAAPVVTSPAAASPVAAAPPPRSRLPGMPSSTPSTAPRSRLPGMPSAAASATDASTPSETSRSRLPGMPASATEASNTPRSRLPGMPASATEASNTPRSRLPGMPSSAASTTPASSRLPPAPQPSPDNTIDHK